MFMTFFACALIKSSLNFLDLRKANRFKRHKEQEYIFGKGLSKYTLAAHSINASKNKFARNQATTCKKDTWVVTRSCINDTIWLQQTERFKPHVFHNHHSLLRTFNCWEYMGMSWYIPTPGRLQSNKTIRVLLYPWQFLRVCCRKRPLAPSEKAHVWSSEPLGLPSSVTIAQTPQTTAIFATKSTTNNCLHVMVSILIKVAQQLVQVAWHKNNTSVCWCHKANWRKIDVSVSLVVV